jgi:hypothetical protein
MTINYALVFLGEFGYELLNWQGVARKLRAQLGRDAKVIACSRAGMQPFYETADAFVDISALPAYRASTAAGYRVLEEPMERICDEVVGYVLERLPWLSGQRTRFIFSHQAELLEGLTFGTGGIYADLDVENNLFVRIEPDLSEREQIEKELGFTLETDYVLCQGARRDIVVRSQERMPLERLLERLGRRSNVVLLNFDTGRYCDSYSRFEEIPNCVPLSSSTFTRQGCLIHFARTCVFFTEGDFRSHMYVPPFVGHDVFAVAPAAVYRVQGFEGQNTAPIAFWNKQVFRFGGQIRAYSWEDVGRDEQSIDAFVSAVLGGVPERDRGREPAQAG